LCPDVTVYGPGMRKGLRGLEQAKDLVAFLRTVFPDLWIKIEEEIAGGDAVALRWSTGGTQRGEWVWCILPTGKTVRWAGMSFYRVVNGRISEERFEEDLLHVEQEVGVVLKKKSP